MKLTLLLLAPLAAYASNATTAAATTAAAGGNATAGTTAAATAAATAAGTTAAPAGTTAAPAGTTAAAAAATAAKSSAPAATKAANTTAAAATDKKVKIAIPAVKVTVDFTVVNTAALKTAAATAVYDGVKTIATGIKTGGSLFAKFDSQFGTTGLPGTTGYDAARRLAAAETVNDFKYVVTVPAADHATTMSSAQTAAAAVTATAVGDAIKAQFVAKGNLGNVTVSFDPAGMAVSDPAPAGTGSTSGAAAVTGFAAMVFAGLYSLF